MFNLFILAIFLFFNTNYADIFSESKSLTNNFYYNNTKAKKSKNENNNNPIINNELNKTVINLNTTNVISLKGVINSKSVNRFLYEFNLNNNKNNLFIFIDSVGGSVEDGYKIISEIKKYNVSCVTEKAYSMAFAILQVCHKRYLLPYGKIMQHQISFGITNELGKIESYLIFVNQMENELLKLQSDKIGITPEELKNKTNNEWWLFGDNALNENCVDEIVYVECSKELTKETYLINDGMYDYIYSKCPLIPDYLDKIQNNKNSKDFIYFI
tara:strand:+ start:923 stop:1735 length:813 start_codon:yes stop_codon:yes gene_type:complete